MKIRVVFAVATFLPPSLICLPLRAADSAQSDAERLKILEDAVRQLQQRNAKLEARCAVAPVHPDTITGGLNYYIHGEGLELP